MFRALKMDPQAQAVVPPGPRFTERPPVPGVADTPEPSSSGPPDTGASFLQHLKTWMTALLTIAGPSNVPLYTVPRGRDSVTAPGCKTLMYTTWNLAAKSSVVCLVVAVAGTNAFQTAPPPPIVNPVAQTVANTWLEHKTAKDLWKEADGQPMTSRPHRMAMAGLLTYTPAGPVATVDYPALRDAAIRAASGLPALEVPTRPSKRKMIEEAGFCSPITSDEEMIDDGDTEDIPPLNLDQPGTSKDRTVESAVAACTRAKKGKHSSKSTAKSSQTATTSRLPSPPRPSQRLDFSGHTVESVPPGATHLVPVPPTPLATPTGSQGTCPPSGNARGGQPRI